MSVFGKAAAALATSRRENAVQRQQNAVLERQWALADAERAQADEDRQRRQQTEDLGLLRTLMTDPTLASQLQGAPTAGNAPAMAGAGAAGAALGSVAGGIGTSPIFAAASSAVADQATRRQAPAPALADVAARTGATYQGSVADQRLQAHRALDQARPGAYGAFDPNVDYQELAREERTVFDKARRILASGYTKDAARAEALARDGLDIEKLNEDRADRAEQRRIQAYNAETSRRGVDQQRDLIGLRAGGAAGKTTEGERRGGAILGLVEQANAEIGRLGGASLGANALSRIPLVGGYASRTVDDESLQRDQAGTQFVTNLLYLLSGATASQQEIDSNKRIYIPAPGDDAATLAQKATARAQALQSARLMAGAAAGSSSIDSGNIDLRAGSPPWADVPGFEPPPGGQ